MKCKNCKKESEQAASSSGEVTCQPRYWKKKAEDEADESCNDPKGLCISQKVTQ